MTWKYYVPYREWPEEKKEKQRAYHRKYNATRRVYIPYRDWPEEKKEKHRAYRRKYCATHRPAIPPEWADLSPQLRYWKRLMADPIRKAIHLEKKRASEARRYAYNKAIYLKYGKMWRERRKKKAVDGYGGKCACCGESELAFLTIDHKNNDGAERRKNGERSGDRMYSKVIKENFPPEYQALCMNCNFAKGMFGECPHQKKTSSAGAIV